jgi:uncharacterized protein YutE (UPF0331/DUF86 family)
LGRPVPHAIATQWSNLLTQRVLLYKLRQSFADRDDYVRKSIGLDLEERTATAALERFAEDVINVFIDISKDLLRELHPDDVQAIKDLPAEAVLKELEKAKVVDHGLFEQLDDVREGRNTLLQHGSSFAPAAAVWLTIEQTNGTIDRAMAALQKGFGRAGYSLEVELPDIS